MCGIAGFYQLKHDVFKDYSFNLLRNKLKNKFHQTPWSQ